MCANLHCYFELAIYLNNIQAQYHLWICQGVMISRKVKMYKVETYSLQNIRIFINKANITEISFLRTRNYLLFGLFVVSHFHVVIIDCCLLNIF